MKRFGLFALAALIAATLFAGAGTLSAQTTAPAGDVTRGHHLFDVNGCYLCHNYNGTGTGSRKPGQNPGPNLAPGPIAFSAFITQVRTPRLSMPPYAVKILSDQDVADIYAFLASQPPTRDWHSIALITAVNAGKPSAAGAGAVVYSANCAACHGAQGQGGVGPSLIGESSRKNAAAVAAFVKNPIAPMPKLFPGVLSENDVSAVAAYVETLH